MKVISLAAAGIALALIAATLAPAAGEYRAYFAIGALVCAAVALLTIVVGWHEGPATRPVREPVASPTVASPSSRSTPAAAPTIDAAANSASVAAPPAVGTVSGEAEVVGFLATLQEKGRLVDFLQDDITGYSDAQVGAAARFVHQGCKAVLSEYFRIVPVRDESEGAKVAVPAGYVADEYRLVGKISGQAPFTGTLMHRGWKAESVSLPRLLRSGGDRLPTIAPAEVELR